MLVQLFITFNHGADEGLQECAATCKMCVAALHSVAAGAASCAVLSGHVHVVDPLGYAGLLAGADGCFAATTHEGGPVSGTYSVQCIWAGHPINLSAELRCVSRCPPGFPACCSW
jgi:hypothetical protein